MCIYSYYDTYKELYIILVSLCTALSDLVGTTENILRNYMILAVIEILILGIVEVLFLKVRRSFE